MGIDFFLSTPASINVADEFTKPMEQPEDNDCYAWVTDPFSHEPSELNKNLQDFEQSSLQCEICRQFYCNAVSLRDCHHSFCSECIRVSLSIEKRGMKRIGSCPICRKEVKEDSVCIMPNWALQVCFVEGDDFPRSI